MITFFHTADIHFGVENYGRIDPITGIHTRLIDFKKSLSICIDKAIDEQIDFFLFCGDAYKTAYPTPTQQKLLMEQFFRLYRVGIPVVIIVGNHDHPLSYGKASALDVFAHLPVDGFYLFSKPDKKIITTKNGIVQIVGIPWPMRHNLVTNSDHRFKNAAEITQYIAQRIGQIIQHLAGQLDDDVPAVLAGHMTVSSGIFSGSEKCAVFGNDPVLLPSQLAINPFDYVALGHLHRHQDLNKNGYPPVVYAGSPERVDFGERKESKGFCRVMIKTQHKKNGIQKSCKYYFEELPVRSMVHIEVQLQGADHTRQILDALARHTIDDAIIKIVYHVPKEMQDTVDLRAVRRACASAHYIAGIIPVHKPVTHQRRAVVKDTMDVAKALDAYFAYKQKLDTQEKEMLVTIGKQLWQEIANEHDTFENI